MADKSVTAANVIPSALAQKVRVKAGAALTAGQPVYQDTDGSVKPAKANGAAPICNVFGIVDDAGATGQDVIVVTSDPQFTPGFTIAAGDTCILSGAVAGNIAPVADNTTGWFNTVLMVGIGGNKANFNPLAAGVAT